MGPRDFLTVYEAADALGIAHQTVRKLIQDGAFAHAFLAGADWLIPRKDLTPALRARYAQGPRRTGRPSEKDAAALHAARARAQEAYLKQIAEQEKIRERARNRSGRGDRGG